MKNILTEWNVEKIGVIGPGIVGMPMAGMLANARIQIGLTSYAKIMVIQRESVNSGWKVDAINSGNSVIGGIEPGLDKIVENSVKDGLLTASHDFIELVDADMILIAVQTDKVGFRPDYGPLMGALDSLCNALQKKAGNKQPVIVFESTLAPSSMSTVIKDKFEEYGLVEGRDIFLGNSPNRVMPGRLVERVRESDKLIAGLHPDTPNRINSVYSKIVTVGTLYKTNSLTAEIVKTLENAYRDVRIAFSSEITRYCDENNIDFYRVRNKVNQILSQADNASEDPNAVPSGAILIPTLGVGGHCLPKDGILLWWRGVENGLDTSNSIILKSRIINEESPANTIFLAEETFGLLDNKSIALLGTAYRFNSADTRNSPTLFTAKLLQEKGCRIMLHDPFVKGSDQNLNKFGLTGYFTNDLKTALLDADYAFFCTAHKPYIEQMKDIMKYGHKLIGLVDACNIYSLEKFQDMRVTYTGIGRGLNEPTEDFSRFVYESFQLVETGLANELNMLIDFLNEQYVEEKFNRVEFKEVQRLAASCSTGCMIVNPGPLKELPTYKGFFSSLAECAAAAAVTEKSNLSFPKNRNG